MLKLFFSYSHKDEYLRNELETHLAPLKREGVISSWHDRRIVAGNDLNQAISLELETSHIILLLVSAYFIESDYCYDIEMKRALEKHKEGSAVVIPVILHPCDWHSAPFGKLRATPTDGKPISKYANQHEAFDIIAKDIREVAKSITAPKSLPKDTERSVSNKNRALQEDRSSNLSIKRKFDDLDRDEFLEDSYEYMARYFEKSLKELKSRNPSIKIRFKRKSDTSFEAFIYNNGVQVTQCSIWCGGSNPRSRDIFFSNSADALGSSFNESLIVEDDGHNLQLKPWGLPMLEKYRDVVLSQQGAAEYYWSLFIGPLQE